MSRVMAVAMLSVALAACAGTVPTPTPTASISPSPAPPTDRAAAFIAIANGTVECEMFPHGCLASLIIEPGAWTPPADWEPSAGTPTFGAKPTPWALREQAVMRAPPLIAPGEYTFGIAVTELNDVIGDPDPYLSSRVLCTETVTVPSGTTTVTVRAQFDEPCAITVSMVERVP